MQTVQDFSLSNTIRLKRKEVARGMRIATNPVREIVQLYFNNMPPGNYTLQMINTAGQTTYNKNINLVNRAYEIKTIERTAAMASGTCFVRLTSQSSQAVSAGRIVLQ